MKAMTWEEAHRNNDRAFYESYVQTIRLCPENYCLAFQGSDGKFVAARMDGAVGKPNYDKIQSILDSCHEDEWLDKIGRLFPRRKYGYCYGIKERS